MIIVIGDSEVENRTVALRDRRARERSEISYDNFISLIKEKMNKVKF